MSAGRAKRGQARLERAHATDLTGQSFTFDAENVLREVNGSGGAMT